MSQQLLTIETAFLSNENVKANLQLTSVRSIQRAIENGQKKKFEQSLTLSALVKQGADWFKSAEGKALRKEEGIEWTTEDFALKVYGWQKSFFHKMVKAGALPNETIETFKAKCEELEAQGEKPVRTIEGLLKYAGQVQESAEGGEGEGEGGEGDAQVETREKVVLTLSLKGEQFGMGNVSVRLNSDGTTKTTNTIDEIRTAISILMGALAQETPSEDTSEEVMAVDYEELEANERMYGEEY
jgi:hypothetical protein